MDFDTRVPSYLVRIITASCNLTARDFFNLMRNNSVDAVIDTRRSTDYWGVNFAHGKDFPYLCEVHGITYHHALELAPSREARERFHHDFDPPKTPKDTRAEAWTTFLETYADGLEEKRSEIFDGSPSPLRNLLYSDVRRVAVICACHHHEDCHRQVTAVWLKRELGASDLEIEHVYNGNPPEKASPRRILLRSVFGIVPTKKRGGAK